MEYANGGGMWVEARLLTAGMTLVDEDGNAAVVVGIVDQRLASGVTVYNFEVEDTHSYFVADALGNAVWVHNGKPCNLNTNNAVSNFGLYKITINGMLYKIGKADMSRITQSSGLPTRLHQQIRKLEAVFGKGRVTQELTSLGKLTTASAKNIEAVALQNHFNKTGFALLGNWKSFRPAML